MSVTDLDSRRHASYFPATHLPPVDRAEALTALARCWEQIASLLSTGPDSLSDDEAHECLQVMASALVHPAAIPGLVFALPQLLIAVRNPERVRDGDVQVAARHFDSAMAERLTVIDETLWPLLSGLPLADACRSCRRRGATVAHWRPARSCDLHPLVAL